MPSRRPASKNDRPPRQYLATPQVLFDRLHMEDLRVEGGCGQVLTLSHEHLQSFKRLNALRNDFAHFTPRGWSIELGGLPKIFSDIIDVICKIKADPWPFRHLSPEASQQFGEHVAAVKLKLEKMI